MAGIETLANQLRRADYRRKLAAGKSPMEAMRALKRRLSNVVYQQMVRDDRTVATGPGGHSGATVKSCAADPNPQVNTSEQSLPEPPTTSLEHNFPTPLDTEGSRKRKLDLGQRPFLRGGLMALLSSQISSIRRRRPVRRTR